MGLDVTAYRKLTKLDVVFDTEGAPIDPATREPVDYCLRAYINYDFPGRADELENHAVYRSEEWMRGWSGGYGRYNHWRNTLAKVAGWPLGSYQQYGQKWDSYAASAWDATSGPFWELICFSDCDGVIGAAVSAKLAKDFAEHDEKAKAEGDAFYEQYALWRKVFEMAADGGAVHFH